MTIRGTAAKDLRTEAPRDFGVELEGYAHLPRMLDKARAHILGTSGTYTFGCPVDHTCMARLGIGPELVLDVAARHADDHAALEALKAHGIPPAHEAWFDSRAVEDELQATDTYLRVRDSSALADGVFAGDEHGARVSLVLVSLAPGEGQPWHSHPTEEVVAVVDGEVTYFLGERQARTVRAGEMARVPADVPHRCVNRGREPLRAVAAYAGGAVETKPAAASQSTAM